MELILVQQYNMHRKTNIPARFKDYFIISTVGQRETLYMQTDFMNKIYFSLIDCMLIELNDRFSSKTLVLMRSMTNVYPESKFLIAKMFMNFVVMLVLIRAVQKMNLLLLNQCSSRKRSMMLFNF